MSDQTGKDLRTQLESANELNKQLTGQLAAKTAESYSFVSADQLADIPHDQLEAKATELQTQAETTRLETIKDVLRTNGVSDDEVDAQAEAMVAGKGIEASSDSQQNQDDGGWSRATEVAQSGGDPAPVVNPGQLHGAQAIAYGLAEKERSRTS